jgi:hypothetical protein
MVLPTPLILNYYDYQKGYINTNPGWYEHTVYSESHYTHLEIVEWLYTNIDNPERHCRWCRFDSKMCVKFRYEKDYLWFSLSF